MASFKYDIVTLIELVESKPCLWDKTNESNKNKILREKSWKEIFQYSEDGYEVLSQAEKKKTGDMIMNKWSNIRDSFLRSLRTKSGQGAKRNYIYGEHLQFLLKISLKDDTDSNFSQATFEGQTEDAEYSQLGLPSASNSEPLPTSSQPVASTSNDSCMANKKTANSKRSLDNIEFEILTELKKRSDEPRSDQEMLLLSFLPYTRDMRETELMDLQMEILTTIKRIKQRRDSSHGIFQQHEHTDVPPLHSPAVSHTDSYQSSHQSLIYQSPPSPNQMADQYVFP